jgi:hypothetical protein
MSSGSVAVVQAYKLDLVQGIPPNPVQSRGTLDVRLRADELATVAFSVLIEG